LRTIRNSRARAAFTLIELLIVVAIIAILAAIAVPNFIEAQVRAKVSRTLADVRSLKTGLESYAVDHNIYPEGDFGETNLQNPGVGLYRLTTPISYITSVFTSPWEEQNMGFGTVQKNCNRDITYLYVRARMPDPLPVNGTTVNDTNPANDQVDDSYQVDRAVYLRGSNITPAMVEFTRSGTYMVKSVGPNNVDDRNTIGTSARVYDPTNGTVSNGDIVTFQDTEIQARQQ